jgi:hypothetical protein
MRAAPLVAAADGVARFEGVPWVRVGPSALAGRGVFACRPFAKGDLLLVFGGKACDRAEGRKSRCVARLRGAGGCRDGSNTVAGMLNTSRSPNAALRESGGVYARSRVTVGEELTISYGSGYHSTWKLF